MVLKAQIRGYDIGRVFMDTGSGINLIYVRTLKAMNITGMVEANRLLFSRDSTRKHKSSARKN
jgi:hypothetical protein